MNSFVTGLASNNDEDFVELAALMEEWNPVTPFTNLGEAMESGDSTEVFVRSLEAAAIMMSGGMIRNKGGSSSKKNNSSAATTSAADRAKQVHSSLDSRAQRMRTTAVTETQEGVRVISSSNRRLSPAQRAQLRKNEVEGVGVGHAEATGIQAAKNMGLKPVGTAASRPICVTCSQTLINEGVQPLSPLK